jgi:drug/metabolite transporter (DMT)-like permease
VGAPRRGIAQCALAAVLFGATTPIASRIADDMNAGTLAGLLYLGAVLAVAPFRRRDRRVGSIVRRGGHRLAIAVAAGGLLGPLALAAGLSRTPAATASLLLNFELVATAILAALFFGEHVGPRIAAGTALVVAAGITLTWSGAPELRIGAALIVIACVLWGLDNCVTADLDTIAPHEITLAKGLIAGPTNLTLGVLAAGALPDGPTAALALALGAVGYGASITLWVRGAQQLGAARGQFIFASGPFVGVLVAWLLLGEDITTLEVMAMGLAGAGVLLVLGSDHEHAHVHEAIEHEHEHEHDEHHRHHDHRVEGRHTHRHRHEPLVHAHPHVPDLHHRHEH